MKDLYKIYRLGEERVRALNGVDFNIYKGEFCAIVGTSGSGKSTLLNMLAGLEHPTKGKIVSAGEHVENKSENQLVAFRRKHIGFIFQSYNLLPTLNAIENVALPLSFQGIDRKTRNKRAMKQLELVGLSTHMKHKPTQMSGGQQQRVGMARALVVEPEIIFADEPTGALNSSQGKHVLDVFSKIHQDGQSVVMVTHDLKAACRGNRILFLRDGRIDGELNLGMYHKEEEKDREEQLYHFLQERNW